jgi:hypothetical protein
MPVLQKGVAAISGKMPKIISPKTHSIVDYATIGSFALLAAKYWGRNRRAAIAAAICAGAELVTVLLTDFPGGITNQISLPTHVKIDFGLAAAASAIPSFLRFDDETEAKWFRMLGLNVTTVAAMTDTGGMRRHRRQRRAA